MATVRTHRYTLAPDKLETFLTQRAELIGQWRAALAVEASRPPST